MKIFISQHYSRNKGNISLLFTLVEVLKKQYPESEIMVSSFDPTDTATQFGYRTCEWPFRTRLIVDSKKIKRLLMALLEMHYLLLNILAAILIRYRLINHNSLKGRLITLKLIKESNVVISPGGHLFTNYNKFAQVFAHFFPCFLSMIMRKDYVVMAQTIGPFFGIWKEPTKILTKFVLKKAKFVTIRDNNSFEQISKLNIRINDLRLTNEIVYLFPEKIENRYTIMSKKKLGFTFHHIYYKRWMNKEEYTHRMVDFINRINNEYDFDIQFISMEKEVNNKSDLPLIMEIKSLLKNQNNIEIIGLPQKPNDLLSVFGDLDYLVATKTHSVVYGLRMCIPTLAIAYEKKTEDFMKDFNQEDFSIQLSNFDPEFAFSKFSILESSSDEIKKMIQSKLTNIQAKSFENIELLAQFL